MQVTLKPVTSFAVTTPAGETLRFDRGSQWCGMTELLCTSPAAFRGMVLIVDMPGSKGLFETAFAEIFRESCGDQLFQIVKASPGLLEAFGLKAGATK